jgi:hypothetical protein
MALGIVAGIGFSMLTEGLALGPITSLLANMAGDALIGAGSELAANGIDGQRVNGSQVGIAAGAGALMGLVFNGAGVIGSKLRGTSNRPFGGLMMVGDTGLETLPRHVFSRIAVHLNGSDLQSVALVSRQMSTLVKSHERAQLASMLREYDRDHFADTIVKRFNNLLKGLKISPAETDSFDGFISLSDAQANVREFQNAVMGNAPYRAGIILHHGLPVRVRGVIAFRRVHPRVLFHRRLVGTPDILTQEERDSDYAYMTFLLRNMPDTQDIPENFARYRLEFDTEWGASA